MRFLAVYVVGSCLLKILFPYKELHVFLFTKINEFHITFWTTPYTVAMLNAVNGKPESVH